MTTFERMWTWALLIFGVPAVATLVYCLLAMLVSFTYWQCVHNVYAPHIYELPAHQKKTGDSIDYVPDTNIREYKP